MSALIRKGNLIDGQWSDGGVSYPVYNPAFGLSAGSCTIRFISYSRTRNGDEHEHCNRQDR